MLIILMKKKGVIRGLFFLIFSAILLLGFLLFFKTKIDFAWHELHAEKIEAELGFKMGSPYFDINGEKSEINYYMTDLDLSGIFYRSGVKNGDVIMVFESGMNWWDTITTTGFYRWLERRRGRFVSLVVVKGGDGRELEKRERKVVQFFVPE